MFVHTMRYEFLETENLISETQDHVVQGLANFLKICKASQNFGHCKSDVKHLTYWAPKILGASV
jgi:hypothetical protein